MKKLTFIGNGFEDYVFWQTQDKKILKKINALLKDIDRDSYNGLGKPEPLKGDKTGWYSREIDKKHRLVYKVEDDSIIVIQCRNH